MQKRRTLSPLIDVKAANNTVHPIRYKLSRQMKLEMSNSSDAALKVTFLASKGNLNR
jgi:hypothetical protein